MKNTNSWFKVTQINDSTWAISESNHDEETNSYLLVGDEKALLIDTGMGIENIYDVVKTLTEKEIITVITHAHWDHIGSNNYSEKLLIHKNEAEWLEHFPLSLTRVKDELMKTSKPLPESFNIDEYYLPRKKPTGYLEHKMVIGLGNRDIVVIHTPGHSPGHCVFFDLKTKFLFTGDLIYEGELDCYYPSTDPLKYMKSVKKLIECHPTLIFGSHHKFPSSPELIQEIYNAFNELYISDKLIHSNKCYSFKNFSIRL